MRPKLLTFGHAVSINNHKIEKMSRKQVVQKVVPDEVDEAPVEEASEEDATDDGSRISLCYRFVYTQYY